ncbi:MAG: [Bacteroidales bacterium]|nr:[FeFe] hydrogenase H-cluster maturation GTPase HydF [Bacteroidales bacterium]
MNEHRENKLHIGFFGRCNTGKSTLINTLTGQNTSIVSQQKGTTTDIVKKTIELYGIGAVVLIDTAGIDDDTELGKKRVEKTKEVFSLIDMCVIVVSDNLIADKENELILQAKRYSIPYILVHNKEDLSPANEQTRQKENLICVSLMDKTSKERLTQFIKERLIGNNKPQSILEGIVSKNDIVILVTPIDSSAPKGRMILPQVKTIREVIDNNAISIVVKETELEYTLSLMKNNPPKLVITDSQIFSFVEKIVPDNIFLTSFSILLAKEKGDFELYLKGTPYLDNLKDGDKVLMLESCTHQPTCEDIGRVKLPMWIKKYTGKEIEFDAVAGLMDMKEDVKNYKMVIQCGGCVATSKQLHNRLLPFVEENIPVSNYGLTIAYINGIFNRAIKIFSK